MRALLLSRCFVLLALTPNAHHFADAVAPGHTISPMVEATYSGDKARGFGKDTPMGRPAQPEEIAPSFVFLASDIDSSFMSGQVLHPNGGMPVHG